MLHAVLCYREVLIWIKMTYGYPTSRKYLEAMLISTEDLCTSVFIPGKVEKQLRITHMSSITGELSLLYKFFSIFYRH